MWKPSHDVKGGVGLDDSKFYDRPSQRRRWDAFGDPKLLPSHFEYSPPRSSRWDASTQLPSERRLQQRPSICLEYKSSSTPRPVHCDVSTQVPSLRPSHIVDYHSSPSRPARIAGGNGCNCCPCPPMPCERPVESCLPGLHQKYVDVYDTKGHVPEGHLPAGYRRFVEHDDLYLPPSRVLSPASTDHDDLYLPLKSNEYSPRECCPCDLRVCDPDPTYGDIYLPPSRPCTPAFPKDPCGYPPPCPPPCCPPPPCRPICPPPPPPCPPPSCPPSRQPPKIVCSCPPYIKKLAPCPPPPPPNDCSCSPYIKKLSGCSPPPSCPPSPPSYRSGCCRPVQQCSSVYIDEVPSPPPGTRYVACQECLCHKDISTRNLCPVPGKISPCRDCVCHLGARSPSQGGSGCPPKGAHTRCQAGFQSPGKPRLKINLNQSAQCLECKSPYHCKGPPNCNPQYIVETPLYPNSARSRSPSPGLRPRSPMGAGKCSTGPPPSSRCNSCDSQKGGSSSSNKCGGPPKVSPKLFEDPCCSPCRPPPPGPLPRCRPLLAAEMLSGMEACVSQAKACGRSTASCMDPRCGSCDCHKPKCPPPPCRPAPPPCRPPSPPSSPCSKPSPPPCRSPPSPCRPLEPSCSSFDDVHNPTFKSFQSTSPRCKDCDCHKPKNCKLSSQVCKFCRGAGWCYCEYHTTLQLLTDSEGHPSPHQDKEVEETVVSQVSAVSPEISYRSADLPARSAKVEFTESPRDEDTVKDAEPESYITAVCCCGKCEYTKPRFPMKTECPFCRHTHSCCCGMCSCPIPTCSSKMPLEMFTPGAMSVNSSSASTGRANTLPYRKSMSPIAPRKKLGFASPDKSTPGKPFSTANSHLSNARMCYSSPKTRLKQSPTRR